MHLPPLETLTERITDSVAIIGVLTWLNPRLFQMLSDYSQLAGLLLPIFGCIWLAVQIWTRIFRGK